MLVLNILRNVTDGYFINIGHPEDTSILEKENMWEGLYLNDLSKPLYETMIENNSSTLTHYFTIHEKFDVYTMLKTFFEKVNSIPGWKKRLLVLRVPNSEQLKKYLLDNFYVYISSDGNYDYFIHEAWSVLL